ncbi:MAG: hypothetical protein B0A82_25820 [Alkalinema sp. CACIAM 70d]|nr:MAG: hypothetical protein B0A82_25820 [Alkalinema sp. CACIAM 70d]
MDGCFMETDIKLPCVFLSSSKLTNFNQGLIHLLSQFNYDSFVKIFLEINSDNTESDGTDLTIQINEYLTNTQQINT